MSAFKVGDRVTRARNPHKGRLTFGKSYEVLAARPDEIGGDEIQHLDDRGVASWWCAEYYELAVEPKSAPVVEKGPFRVGDVVRRVRGPSDEGVTPGARYTVTGLYNRDQTIIHLDDHGRETKRTAENYDLVSRPGAPSKAPVVKNWGAWA